MNSSSEQTIFTEALSLPPEARAAYLARATSGNPLLRRRIESLLGSYGTSEFLEEVAAPEIRQVIQRSVPLSEKPGDTISHYRLLQQIGEGGCGVVYMAEQSEPVRRRVALKIIKFGMDTKSVIARFEAERQALAMMDHPNIAKVFDAGATETGRPYFVMELVRGRKITDYCDEARLSTRARLDLFIQVCQAIQHAHQKGIIHRDIKPSNILVTVNDGVAVPKVIDFGIAKATTGQQLTDKTIFTAFEQFIGTPAYMSPEQAVMTSLDIDTRSDIYALGVLLYELLTGKTPFDAKELLAIGLDEMRRTIREREPLRPSTCLSTLSNPELSTTAQRRGLEAPKLVSELRGDLDWIVMKALEKDRARRYETANGLAADVKRHLHSEPLEAGPPSTVYRFQKMARRNKLVFAAGSAVVASLLLGVTLSTVSFFRERAARERADEQAAIAQAVNDFLQLDLLQQAAGYFQAEAGFKPDPNLTVREALDRAATRIEGRFKDQPLQEAAVRVTIGIALHELGESERAIPHLQRSMELFRSNAGPDHLDTLRAMNNLAVAYRGAAKPDQALPLFEQTLKFTKAKLGSDHSRTLGAMNNLAIAYREAGKIEEGLRLQDETLKLMKAKLGTDNPTTLNAMNNLAFAYRDAGQLDRALPLHEEALKLMKAKLGPDHPDILATLVEIRARGGQFAEAAAHLARVRELKPQNNLVWHQMAILFAASGQLDVYREHCRQSIERFGQTTDPLTAERIAKACLILPSSGADIDLLVKMADTAAAATNTVAVPWFQFVKALAEYRNRHFSEAVEWANKTLIERGHEPARDVEAYMTLAMANSHLQQASEAQAAFLKGAEIERTKLPKLESGDIGDHWEDWIIAHALMREAEALLRGSPATNPEIK